MSRSSTIGALALLLGCAVGFGGAVVAGYQATQYSKPDAFKRFHFSIGLETNFFPTFPMMENLALARWHPGQTVVVIGGNSIFNGVGQPASDLWSDHLQSELGSDFVVVNLAFRGAFPPEGGALVAESLQRRGVPVVYVTDNGPGNCGRPFGSFYGYLFWDALYKDRLLPFPARDAYVADWLKHLSPADRTKQEELQRAARLDAVLRFQSLWQHVGYRHVFTVWNSIIPGWWRPRDKFSDPEPGAPPVEQRFRGSPAGELSLVRSLSETRANPDGHGGWEVYQPAVQSLDEEIDTVFPPVLRPHMLMVMTQSCPHYRDMLTPSERVRDEKVFAAYRDKWREKGIACTIVGLDWTNEDFADRCHLAAGGGRKLAHIVAGEVRTLTTRKP
jgi:hypothetical protein